LICTLCHRPRPAPRALGGAGRIGVDAHAHLPPPLPAVRSPGRWPD